MHELSIGTWFIHLTTLVEWFTAIIILSRLTVSTGNKAYNILALAMLPNLASAMAAITWHIYDNSAQIESLVLIQAILTALGNTCLAFAAWNLFRKSSEAA